MRIDEIRNRAILDGDTGLEVLCDVALGERRADLADYGAADERVTYAFGLSREDATDILRSYVLLREFDLIP